MHTLRTLALACVMSAVAMPGAWADTVVPPTPTVPAVPAAPAVPPAAVANPPPAAAAPAEPAPAEDPKTAELKAKFQELMASTAEGPTTGKLGAYAEVAVPAGIRFADRLDTVKIYQMTDNLPSGKELGILFPNDFAWWMVFAYNDTGHVPDDDKEELDADALLKSMREGTEAENRTRLGKSLPTLQVTGWTQKPRYEPTTHNLEWAPTIQDSNGTVSVNYNVRLLGRTGVMEVTLICGPEDLATALPAARKLITGFRFVQEQDYKAFRQGDKVAEYGLAALVAGGAVAVAAKTGLLAKFWKLLVFAGVAAAGGIRRLFGRKSDAGPQ